MRSWNQDIESIDLTRHVKIWFNKTDSLPSASGVSLGFVKNELRLIRHRTDYPNHEITLITNKNVLKDNAETRLQEFCEKYNITIIDIADIEIPDNVDDKDIQEALLDIAKQEISEGNLASASDIIRVLSPVLALGCYSDLDFPIKPAIFEGGFQSPTGFLGNVKQGGSSNDFLAVNEPNHALVFQFRKNIHERYTEPGSLAFYTDNNVIKSESESDSEDDECESCLSVVVQLYVQLASNEFPSSYLSRLYNCAEKDDGPTELREKAKSVLDEKTNKLKNKMEQYSKLSPKYKKYEKKCQQYKHEYGQYIKHLVIITSGPNATVGNITAITGKKVDEFSLNQLCENNDYFTLGYQSNDASWIPGYDPFLRTDEKMDNAAKKIQRSFRLFRQQKNSDCDNETQTQISHTT